MDIKIKLPDKLEERLENKNDKTIFKWIGILSFALLLMLFVGLKQRAGSPQTPTVNEPTAPVTTSTTEPAQDAIDGSGEVVKVVDGDTIDVMIDGVATRIRIAQINTPESVAPEEYTENTGKENTDNGKIASDYAKEMLSDKIVYYEFCEEDTDEYGRKLAYIYLDKYAATMYEAEILKEGYAELVSIKPNTKYTEYLEKFQNSAKDADKGFWKGEKFNG